MVKNADEEHDRYYLLKPKINTLSVSSAGLTAPEAVGHQDAYRAYCQATQCLVHVWSVVAGS